MAYLEIYQSIADYLGISLGSALALMTILAVWTFAWKGVALWKSAKKDHLIWFVVFLIVNTLGVLEILYIFIFSKFGDEYSRKREVKAKKPARRR
jgi:hypothetical protein